MKIENTHSVPTKTRSDKKKSNSFHEVFYVGAYFKVARGKF
jgi:hypothetical protein